MNGVGDEVGRPSGGQYDPPGEGWPQSKWARVKWGVMPGCSTVLLLAVLFVIVGFAVVNISVQEDAFISGSTVGTVLWLYALSVLVLRRQARLVPRPVRANAERGGRGWWAFGWIMHGLWCWLDAIGNASSRFVVVALVGVVFVLVGTYGVTRGMGAPDLWSQNRLPHDPPPGAIGSGVKHLLGQATSCLGQTR